ncbi:unnamed protein product [Rhizopus microsporus]
MDPVLSSSTYHIHQADNALSTLKHVVLEEGWKKALKHKSGVVVHMKNGMHKGDKIPIFKGEAILQGFSPQAIFYVIGMRKLWDEQYEDGNLVENLNDTTSLTYEIMKPTATSKTRDLALVEKIECTSNGAIIFACTSVETPKIPRVSGRNRMNIKLQGWILEPLHGGPQPATKVVFVIQESTKGWMPGFAKKTLARRPLVIAKVAEYLEKKTERMKAQAKQAIYSGHSRRPSVMSYYTAPSGPPPPPPHHPPRHTNINNNNHNRINMNNSLSSTSSPTIRSSPELSQKPILLNKPPTPPHQRKHITFAEDEQDSAATSNAVNKITPQPLYPLHRHPIQKVEGLQLLKKLTATTDYWTLVKQVGDTKCYKFNSTLEENDRVLPFVRVDGIIHGQWTVEQICSAINCFGSRKVWDTLFEDGKTIERFSQKDYLVHWFLGNSKLLLADTDLSAITTLETDPANGTVYTATMSVIDTQIPSDPLEERIRAQTDLYGWVLTPKIDSQGQTSSVQAQFVYNMDFKYPVPRPVLEAWKDAAMQSIDHLQNYLQQHGCPPYIRRVAGKVTAETFDHEAKEYQVAYTVKHQPSNAYRTRKRQDSVWCTDVRFYRDMFPHGVDIRVIPEHSTRSEVLMDHCTIKVFTTDESMDSKQVTLTLKPLLDDAFDCTMYRYNNVLSRLPVKQLDIKEEKEEQKEELKAPDSSTEQVSTDALAAPDDSIKVPKGYLLISEHQNNNIIVISDELSFNSQQISVIFIAMVLCYYMGKFTSCNSC